MQTAESVKYKIPSRSLLSNLLICVISTGLIAWSIQLIQTRFTSVISRDAVINGVLTDLKAPSEGIVSELSVKTGDTTSQDKVLLTLKNERVSELQAQVINSKINQQQAELERAKEGLASATHPTTNFSSRPAKPITSRSPRSATVCSASDVRFADT